MKQRIDERDIRQWMEDDSIFIPELKSGLDWQSFAASLLVRRGFAVQTGVLMPRENRGEIREYSETDKDVLVAASFNSRVIRVEVKSREFAFTCPSDFKYATAYFETVSGWAKKQLKPHAILCVSRVTRKIVVVPSSTRGRWVQESCYDRTRKIRETNWACPREFLRTFDDFCEWVRKTGEPHAEAA